MPDASPASGTWRTPPGSSRVRAGARRRLVSPSIRSSASCSTPITRPSDRCTRARSAGCCRARRWTRCRLSGARGRRDEAAARQRRSDPDAGRRCVVLGLHHEQQHQELLLTDIKHAFWLQSAATGVSRATAGACRATPHALRFIAGRAGIVEIGHRGEGFAFDNETPRHRVLLQPLRAGQSAGDQRRVSGVRARRWLSRAGRCGCRTAGTPCRREGWQAPAVLGRRDWRR